MEKMKKQIRVLLLFTIFGISSCSCLSFIDLVLGVKSKLLLLFSWHVASCQYWCRAKLL